MEKYKFVTTETVDEILKEHTIRAIEIAAEMNARLADGNCLLGFEKLYREVYPLIVVCDPAKMLAPADNGTQDKKDGHDTKLIRFVEIMQNTKPEKITNEQEREALECFPTFIREYGWGIGGGHNSNVCP
jgi:hypothetical protein